MRRVACSMTAKMYRLAPVSVRVWKKSQASSGSAWLCGKSGQVVLCRCGGGAVPCFGRISQPVEAATLMAKAARSPWILRYPL
jgi:hypothetical protein